MLDHLVPINNVCQQKCNFCSAEYRMEGNPKIPLKKIFEDILKRGNYIQISGGEPLLDPRLYDILYFIRKYKPNCFIEFQSNGLLIQTNNHLSKLMKFGVNLFNINYPSHIEEVNDRIVRIPGTFSKREAALDAILKVGGKLRINIIVNKLNFRYIADTVEYIGKKFPSVERIQLSFTKAMGAADKNDEVVPTYVESSPFYIDALRRGKSLGIKVDVDHIPMCFLGEYFMQHVDYHKIKDGEEGVFFQEKNYVEKCKGCDKQKYCAGYRKDYLELYPEKTYV